MKKLFLVLLAVLFCNTTLASEKKISNIDLKNRKGISFKCTGQDDVDRRVWTRKSTLRILAEAPGEMYRAGMNIESKGDYIVTGAIHYFKRSIVVLENNNRIGEIPYNSQNMEFLCNKEMLLNRQMAELASKGAYIDINLQTPYSSHDEGRIIVELDRPVVNKKSHRRAVN